MDYLIYSIEDDKDIGHIINLTLTKQGYQVVSFHTGEAFREAFKKKKPDMILLDLMLPDCNGFDLLKEVRNNHSNDDIEILIVSAKSQTLDKINGFDLGADDYIEKPFDLLELISRVNAKTRRHFKTKTLNVGNISINNATHVCTVKNKEIRLTNTEFTVLYYLLDNLNKVVSRDDILKALWGEEEAYESRTIDVHINSLRSKLGEDGKRIVSVYGVGYRYLK